MAERVTSVPLEVGLYVLRYVQSRVTAGAPQVFVRASPGSERIVSVVTPPGEQAGSIPAPGGCVVVRAEQSASLHITIRSSRASDETDAELRLESLSGPTASRPTLQAPVYAPAPAYAPAPSPALDRAVPKVEIVGHVSRRGDVRVSDGRWIAGPDSPAPIEGLELRLLDSAPDLAVEYQVLIGGQGGAWTSWMAQGYAGTKGQFRPLTAARVRLVGAAAAQFQLEAEALFLGASISKLKGQSLEIKSASSVDPLVGLKIVLNASNSGAGSEKNQTVPKTSASNAAPASQPGRVRVFRSAGLR